ncbi:MAG: COG1361 S-layer family protein [Halodesulfurarchaeum sp.]
MNRQEIRGFLLAVLVVASIGISLVPAGAAAQAVPPPSMTIRGSPDLHVHVPNPTVTPGETNSVKIQVSNSGELERGIASYRSIVTTARNVRVEANADGTPLTVETGELAIGSITESQPREATLRVTVPEGVEPGTYRIEVDLTYTHIIQQSGSDSTDVTVRTEETIEVVVEDDPHFAIVNATTDAPVGESGHLAVTLTNTGGEPARAVRLSLSSPGPGITFSNARSDTGYVSKIGPGKTATVEYNVSVGKNARVRPYALVGSVTYRDPSGLEYTERDITASVTPLHEQTFEITSVNGNLFVDEEGTLSLTVRNDGPRPVTNPVLALNPSTPHVTVTSPDRALEDLAVGEKATVGFDVTVSDGVSSGMHLFDATVRYTNPVGDRYPSDSLETNVTIRPDRNQFVIEDVTSQLRVGQEESVRFTVSNNRSRTIRNPVLTIDSSDPNIFVTSPTRALPDLAPGERTTVSYEIEVSSSFDASLQQFDLTMQYTDSDGDRKRSDPIETNVRIRPELDRFVVEAVNGTVQAGTTRPLHIRVRNNGNETLRNVEAKAFLDDPLSSSDDTALIPQLEPGETQEIVIDVSVAGSAMEKTYPVSMDFQYELPNGDTKLSSTYKVPLHVTAGDDGGFPLWIAVPILGVVAVLGWQRERLRSLLP